MHQSTCSCGRERFFLCNLKCVVCIHSIHNDIRNENYYCNLGTKISPCLCEIHNVLHIVVNNYNQIFWQILLRLLELPSDKSLSRVGQIKFQSMQKGFIKNKEDFTCENCGAFIIGNGYTNHCHSCLYSKHVDIAPGDRLATCLGIMKPTAITGSTNNMVITHTCQICGFTRNNKVQEQDDTSGLIETMKKINSKK